MDRKWIIAEPTPEQVQQVRQIVEAATKKALRGLNRGAHQVIIAHGDELKDELTELIRGFHTGSKHYTDVRVKSKYGYLSPKGIVEQTNRLRELFPGLGYANEKLAEHDIELDTIGGWFAIPRWEKIAPTYCEAVQAVLKLIRATRKELFINHCADRLNEHHH